jgi:hypothetical protein
MKPPPYKFSWSAPQAQHFSIVVQPKIFTSFVGVADSAL